MRRRDLFNLTCGTYNLVDNIENYRYTMKVGVTEYGDRCYRIRERGSVGSNSIFMIECYVNGEGGHTFYKGDIRYKTLTAIAGVGGLHVHSNDNHTMLWGLNFIPRGSFKKFIEKTKINKIETCDMLRYECINCGNKCLTSQKPDNSICGGCNDPNWKLSKNQESYKIKKT